MKKYRARISDKILSKKLSSKGAVLIEGAKWCGKTTTASQVAKSILKMQDPAEREQNIRMSEINPSRLLAGKTPRLIDEWQLAPKLWDAIRYEVDERDEFNQFILTGSAVPADFSEISHTRTGEKLFKGSAEIDCENNLDIEQIAYLICRGGWPKSIGQKREIALQQAIDYYDSVINNDISRVDNVKRNPEKTKRLLRSYARSIGTQSKISSLSQDVNPSGDSEIASNPTIMDYIEALTYVQKQQSGLLIQDILPTRLSQQQQWN